MRPPITITITITGSIWPDYYYYYYSGILRSLLLLLLLLLHKSVITITITISNSLTTLIVIVPRSGKYMHKLCNQNILCYMQAMDTAGMFTLGHSRRQSRLFELLYNRGPWGSRLLDMLEKPELLMWSTHTLLYHLVGQRWKGAATSKDPWNEEDLRRSQEGVSDVKFCVY